MTDPRTLRELSTWYLTTNLPLEAASLEEVVRLYGLRYWVEQRYKQMKDELGWASFMVHSDQAIRRHWQLVCCAFPFCWWQEARQAHQHAFGKFAGKKKSQPVQLSMRCRWPCLLRSVWAWLTPLNWLMRCWRMFSAQPPPAEFAKLARYLIGTLGGGINPLSPLITKYH